MLDRESILRRGGELELECPDLGSDLMGKNGESKLSYYKQGPRRIRQGPGMVNTEERNDPSQTRIGEERRRLAIS